MEAIDCVKAVAVLLRSVAGLMLQVRGVHCCRDTSVFWARSLVFLVCASAGSGGMSDSLADALRPLPVTALGLLLAVMRGPSTQIEFARAQLLELDGVSSSVSVQDVRMVESKLRAVYPMWFATPTTAAQTVSEEVALRDALHPLPVSQAGWHPQITNPSVEGILGRQLLLARRRAQTGSSVLARSTLCTRLTR